MMAHESAMQGPPSHLANRSRGRAHILPYQPHGFTGYEHNRPASMPSTLRRLGEAPGPPRVNPNPRAGMPAAGSRTQAPAQVWRMLAEVVHLHLGDEEASKDRVGGDCGIPSSRTHLASRATPQPLLTTRTSLLHLTLEECGVPFAGRSG